MIRIILFVIVIILVLRILLLSRMESRRRFSSNRWYSETDFKKLFGGRNFRKSLQGHVDERKEKKSRKNLIF